jgi:hypothetical protein
MQAHLNAVSALFEACETICSLAAKHAANLSFADDAGGIAASFAIMRRHHSELGIQLQSVAALASIVCDQSANQTALVASGGRHILQSALRAHASADDFQNHRHRLLALLPISGLRSGFVFLSSAAPFDVLYPLRVTLFLYSLPCAVPTCHAEHAPRSWSCIDSSSYCSIVNLFSQGVDDSKVGGLFAHLATQVCVLIVLSLSYTYSLSLWLWLWLSLSLSLTFSLSLSFSFYLSVCVSLLFHTRLDSTYVVPLIVWQASEIKSLGPLGLFADLIGDCSAAALIDLVWHCESLPELDVRDNTLQAHGSAVIARALCRHPRLALSLSFQVGCLRGRHRDVSASCSRRGCRTGRAHRPQHGARAAALAHTVRARRRVWSPQCAAHPSGDGDSRRSMLASVMPHSPRSACWRAETVVRFEIRHLRPREVQVRRSDGGNDESRDACDGFNRHLIYKEKFGSGVREMIS